MVPAEQVEAAARALWKMGNARIGDRSWESVAAHYIAEAAIALEAARVAAPSEGLLVEKAALVAFDGLKEYGMKVVGTMTGQPPYPLAFATAVRILWETGRPKAKHAGLDALITSARTLLLAYNRGQLLDVDFRTRLFGDLDQALVWATREVAP